MTMKSWKSIRVKDAGHRRSKSSEPGKSRHSEILSSIFKPNSKQSKEEEEKEAESAKIEEILARLPVENIHDVDRDDVRAALASHLADGKVEAAIEFLRLQRMSFAGVIAPYNPKVNMLGAENRGNVTCYLDALLFAMFAKMQAFECMLKNDHDKGAPERLAALLRLWVNLLRHGKLIHTDITENLQAALAECGWQDARLLEQQDTSEAFVVITEKLQLPLLALQADMFHQGKGDPDDHKVVFERLLNLAIPEDPEGKGVKLEDCLEEYFNTQVDVHRDSFEVDEKKSFGEEPLLASPVAISPNNLSPNRTIRMVPDEEEDEAANADPSPLLRRWTTVGGLNSSEATSSDSRPPAGHRATSLIQRIIVDGEGKPAEPAESGADSPTFLNRLKRSGSTVIKAVTVPAWQFFRFIPFSNTPNVRPKDDLEVVRQFNQKPVVCICLKRYFMTEAGQFNRLNTYIDVPDSLRLPHFMLSDDAQREANDLDTEYKLVLQSVVCHRGESLQSGHYVSFARVNPKLLTENRRHDSDPPPDYEEAQWVKFDDLCTESRVTPIDDIKASLVEEMPYLLFYQIVPMVDVTNGSTTEGTDETLPPYMKDNAIFSPPAHTHNGPDVPTISRQGSGYFDNTTWTTGTAASSTGPSIRFSSEMGDRPSIDEDRPTATNTIGNHHPFKSSRRGSVAFSEPIATAATPGETEAPPPAVTPNEESTAQRISRAAAKYMGTRSRPASQAGEGRISSTMSRLGGFGNLVRSSKEPLRKSEDGGAGGDMTNGVNTRGGEDPDAHSSLLPPVADENGTEATSPGEHPTHHQEDHQVSVNGGDREREKDKGKGKKKERTKSKNRNSEVDAKEKPSTLTVETNIKEKGKDRGRSKRSKHGEPERECVLM